MENKPLEIPDAGLRAVRSKRATRRWFDSNNSRHRAKSVNLEQAMEQFSLDDIINLG